VASTFSFSGDWPRAVVAASATLFIASFALRNVRRGS
jgi:hypothetical protein